MSPVLHSLARALGLEWQYWDGAGQHQTAPDESLRAICAALGYDAWDDARAGDSLARLDAARAACLLPSWLVVDAQYDYWLGVNAPDGTDWQLSCDDGVLCTGQVTGGGIRLPALGVGYFWLELSGERMAVLSAPASLPEPQRGWGVLAPLYGMQSQFNGAIGSYLDLADTARALGQAGAKFLGINPVHAMFASDNTAFSPYSPSSRHWLSTLHVDVSAGGGVLDPLIDYATAIPYLRTAQRAAFAAFEDSGEAMAAFLEWSDRQGDALTQFALHQALADTYGPYWPDWPKAMQSAQSVEVQQFAQTNDCQRAMRFHTWAQWKAHSQLETARDAARDSGMRYGLYLDLAVGTHPDGAETWADPELFAQGVSLGAPPDPFGPEGQVWNLAPMLPTVLEERGFAPLARILRRQLDYGGILRIDHILGFERGFWVPNGLPGVYVTMPRDALLAVARIEAHTSGAVIVGEDLGVIPDGLRDALAGSGILGCRVAMFERDWNGDRGFTAPEHHPERVMISFGSHDLPLWKGWRAGQDIDWRVKLDLMTPPQAQAAQAERRSDVALFDAAAGGDPGTMTALAGFLARSRSVLAALQLEDLLDMSGQPNLPGTVYDHPNWRQRLNTPAAGLGEVRALKHCAKIMAAQGR